MLMLDAPDQSQTLNSVSLIVPVGIEISVL
jgi:hypothetical protein